MKKFLHWFIEPYLIIRSELKSLSARRRQTDDSNEKLRIGQLIPFNYLLAVLYSAFFLYTLFYIGQAILVTWYSIGGLVITIPMMALAKAAQRKYLRRRDAFIKKDPSLIKHK
ncbi:hypothetical protein CEF21_03025 [Bacillus sp. FJAT-42376]|uniref:hypothetical protein n=1 Tax=Bacillus sp. FJAT-42376 TaxID=2014076 RepID=UPI000F4F330B|nr:hypothetical protein [Bacillus sp. FJAT-42376]AZB41369.1 hypothetical protein CEF21_03025 [Bacillus sp. FJAT-42376]